MTVAERPEVRRYCDDLLLALRMKDVPGNRIGAVLTEVRAHLADSGEGPHEAFGSPEEYAQALAGDTAVETPREWLTTRASGAAIFLGFWWLIEGATALATGQRAELGPVPVGAAAIAGLGAPWLVEQLVAPAHGVAAAARIGRAVLLASLVGVAVVLTGGRWAAEVPGALPLALGAGLLLVGGLLGRADADPVVDPLAPAEEVAAQRERDSRSAHRLVWGSLAVMAAGAVGVAVLLDRLG